MTYNNSRWALWKQFKLEEARGMSFQSKLLVNCSTEVRSSRLSSHSLMHIQPPCLLRVMSWVAGLGGCFVMDVVGTMKESAGLNDGVVKA